ncbi:cbb3-type cytochrome oxidase assembly protein CcoS [Tuwongella immobilis]|uniref:: CcoS n=1 Tax=Tuwongella immobilis TaxID=692036 RepID=A0A6C2YP15_9BACT|nr:cbb3-type cytochrome oxidase assembly protein CcoS [Tuwongella immobilis]VIP02795.1 : CcoS [Tuwongella immobilis]VTS02473.1 : CcoS [Tuwongella immobilis]
MSYDTIVMITLLGSGVFFGGAAIWALAWAVRVGEFENFHRGANSIFDADEPVGQPTDDTLPR